MADGGDGENHWGMDYNGPSVHYLPFKVVYDGPARISAYFYEGLFLMKEANEIQENDFVWDYTNSFRGIKIMGTRIRLEDKFSGTLNYFVDDGLI